MTTVLHESLVGAPEHPIAGLPPCAADEPQAPLRSATPPPRPQPAACFHCGEPCYDPGLAKEGKAFCCRGCLFVHDLLAESGLGQFYELNRHPGVRILQPAKRQQWAYLDDPKLQQRLLDFTDGKLSRITLQIPAIHCVACVWLLENLFRLSPGIGRSQVNFPRREATISFSPEKIALSELVGLLASIGYEPVPDAGRAGEAEKRPRPQAAMAPGGHRSVCFRQHHAAEPARVSGAGQPQRASVRIIFGYLSLALAAPAVFYSASDYWRSAGLSLRRRMLTLDVPIALGLAALYATSAYDIVLRARAWLPGFIGRAGFLPSLRAGVPAEDIRPDGV